MIWTYRIGSCLSPGFRGVRNAQLARLNLNPRSVQRRAALIGPIWRQQWALCPPPPSSRRDFSSSPRSLSLQAEQPKPQNAQRHISISSKKRSSLSYIVVGGSILAAGASLLWWSNSAADDGDVINKSTFRAFTITSKEQVSPTAFILTVRSSSSSSNSSKNNNNNNNDGGGSARIRQAWAHGLWSVEIKQPQLQIARHYTPLPPPACISTAEGNTENELRFLIRKMDGGEMSSYLSRLRVGDAVWLRGPHLGFDVARRLGGGGGGGGDGGGRSVVFLAGGTGVAPALQVAHRLLDGGVSWNDDKDGESGISAAVDMPVISILWANRRGVDALGRPAVDANAAASRAGWWVIFGGSWRQGHGGGDESGKTAFTDEEEVSSLSKQIREMQNRYPDNFRVRYFVDEEKSFIGADEVIAAAAPAAASRNQKETSSPSKQLTHPSHPAEVCPWHSAAALETLPDDDDASRSWSGGDTGTASTCSCATSPGERAGVNLIFVSGPDGFIEAYAGPKKWHAGGEMQGPVRGLVGRLKDGRAELDGWLVLKL